MINKFLQKRIKNIMIIIVVLISIICNGWKVNAGTKDSHLSYNIVNGIYAVAYVDGSYHLYYLDIFKMNDRVAYCIELGVPIKQWDYNSSKDFELSGFSKEINDYIKLVSYYGYDYPGHSDRYEYYMASQELIWEAVSDQDIVWTDELDVNGHRMDIDYYKNEILNLINRHNILPDISFEYSINVGESISVIDNNGVLNDYEVIESDGIDANIVDNTLYISSNGSSLGSKTITLRKKNYLDYDYLLYYYDASQKMSSSGKNNDIEVDINIKVDGASIILKKMDADNMLPLQGALYGLYDNNNNLIYTSYTSEFGEVVFNDLVYDKYIIKELDTLNGYYSDDIYYLDVDSNMEYIEIYSKPIKKKIEIYKTYGDYYSYEEGCIFNIYNNLNNDLVGSIITDSDGYGFIELPYGEYTIKQYNSIIGYESIKDFNVIIDNNDNTLIFNLNDIKMEMEDDKLDEVEIINNDINNSYSIDNPTTYDNILYCMVLFLISFILIIILFKKLNVIRNSK